MTGKEEDGLEKKQGVKGAAISLQRFLGPDGVDLATLSKLSLSKSHLSAVPEEVFTLPSLVDLDLSHNLLASISPAIGQLTRLKYLNLMNNKLDAVPSEIGNLRELYRLGLKGNVLTALPSSIGQLSSLVELFLTDNRLTALPAEMGQLHKLVKLQASFNCLQGLPAEMGSLPELELMRVAVNEIREVPAAFAGLHKLAWFSLGGNPACAPLQAAEPAAPELDFARVRLGEPLGAGASGEVFVATLEGEGEGKRALAFKRFKADVSPDGHARDEVAITCALNHEGLIKVVGQVKEPWGLLLERVEGREMAARPNLESLLRCRWDKDVSFSVDFTLHAATRLSAALQYLHSRRLSHGDVYAHNVIVDAAGKAVLCDYGAAFCYPSGDPVPYEAQEVRAFGLLLKDVVDRTHAEAGDGAQARAMVGLKELMHECVESPTSERPLFASVGSKLAAIRADCLPKESIRRSAEQLDPLQASNGIVEKKRRIESDA